MIAVITRPSAMYPRAFDECVRCFRIELTDGVIRFEWSGEVFCIEPSANDKHSTFYVLQMLREVARLPIIVVCSVIKLVGKEPVFALQIFLVEVRGRPRIQIELICVGSAHIKWNRRPWNRWPIERFEKSVETKVSVEHESAAMICIIAHKEVSHWGLRRCGLQRRMRINHAGRGVKARVGYAPDSRLAVVIGNVLQQELERVVHICTVVYVFWRLFIVNVRAHLYELAFRHIASANILIDEDISGLLELVGWTERLFVLVRSIGSNAVRRAVNQKWIALRGIFRHVNGSKQMHTVTHGNAVFVFCVVCLDVVFFRRGGFLLRLGREECTGKQTENEQTGRLSDFHETSAN